MSLKKEIQLRNGNVSLSIFKGEMDGRILVSFDKEYVSRRVKGPLFTEKEMYELVQLIFDYDEWESKAITGTANKRLVQEPTAKKMVSLADVQAAIVTAREVPSPESTSANRAVGRGQAEPTRTGTITVLPSMPEFRLRPNPSEVFECIPASRNRGLSHTRAPSRVRLYPLYRSPSARRW